ncbi:MAG: fatty acid desaturase, partial [Caldimonas sp.]
EPEWTEGFATVLEGLPVACAAACLGATVYVVWALRRRSLGAGDLAWLGGSLWAVWMFASCVGHELLHRRSELSRTMGRVLSGVIGYPLLEHEHRAHHVKGGNVEAAECPRLDESVWAFTARRSVRVFGTAWEGDVVAASRRGNRLAGGLPVSIAATLVTAAAFGMAAGVKGLVLYALVALAVAWTMQVMAYVQHWGLGADSLSNAAVADLGWEDLCQLQGWLTLNLSYHQAHHHASAVPYYRRQPMQGSPRAPAGYGVLLFVSFVPPLWHALMRPALERWKRAPDAQRTAGRRLICIAR